MNIEDVALEVGVIAVGRAEALDGIVTITRPVEEGGVVVGRRACAGDHDIGRCTAAPNGGSTDAAVQGVADVFRTDDGVVAGAADDLFDVVVFRTLVFEAVGHAEVNDEVVVVLFEADDVAVLFAADEDLPAARGIVIVPLS